jgi:hypothetical protein
MGRPQLRWSDQRNFQGDERCRTGTNPSRRWRWWWTSWNTCSYWKTEIKKTRGRGLNWLRIMAKSNFNIIRTELSSYDTDGIFFSALYGTGICVSSDFTHSFHLLQGLPRSPRHLLFCFRIRLRVFSSVIFPNDLSSFMCVHFSVIFPLYFQILIILRS